MTARSTGVLKNAAASSLSEAKIKLLSSSALNLRPGNSACQSLPMCRLNRPTQRSGCITCNSLAARPTNSLPSASTPTTDGVRTSPNAFGISRGPFSSMQATAELGVPKSMPTILLTATIAPD